MKKIKIKGNDYVMVNERVRQYHIDYPNGKIETELIEFTERCITRTKVTPDVANPERYFTGIAYEKEGSNFINKTSFVEVCETSAWGRALANFGIGIDSQVASAHEVANAIAQTSLPKKKVVDNKKQLTSSQFDAMMKAIRDGESLVVKQRMDNYSMTEDQRKLLMNEIEKQ